MVLVTTGCLHVFLRDFIGFAIWVRCFRKIVVGFDFTASLTHRCHLDRDRLMLLYNWRIAILLNTKYWEYSSGRKRLVDGSDWSAVLINNKPNWIHANNAYWFLVLICFLILNCLTRHSSCVIVGICILSPFFWYEPPWSPQFLRPQNQYLWYHHC